MFAIRSPFSIVHSCFVYADDLDDERVERADTHSVDRVISSRCMVCSGFIALPSDCKDSKKFAF